MNEMSSAPTKRPLWPALKSWIDNVIVPALVEEYLRERAPAVVDLHEAA
jgi:hypothetical protein